MKRINRTGFILVLLMVCLFSPGSTMAPMAVLSGKFSAVNFAASAHAAESGLSAGMIDPKTGKKIKYWVAPMDPTYIRDEPGKSPMGMDLVPVYEEDEEKKEPASTIRIDPVTVQNMGVRLDTVTRKPLVKTIRAFGTLTHDETRVFAVNTKYPGWIEKLYVNFIGKQVKKGDALFDIYSPELVTAQEEYLLAYREYKILKESPYPDIRNRSGRLLNAARTRLVHWDLNNRQIKELERKGTVEKTVTVYSTTSGVVTKQTAILGHFVKPGEHLYEITDLSNIWVDVEIYEYEIPWIRQGMPADIELSYIPGKKFHGNVIYIYPYLTPQTRTAKLRLELANPGLELKPGMYANVNLKSTFAESGLVIPQEAVIDSGVRKLVFISLGKGKYEPREVTLGVETDLYEFQVLDGLKEGDEIVVSAQFMFDSESRIREAIQKMLAAKQGKAEETEDNGMDMNEITMEDDENDLDMSDLTMDGME